MLKKIAKILNKVKLAITNTYICLRYPFLYPRNRFTGLHYNNWKLHQYHVDNYKDAIRCVVTSIKMSDDFDDSVKLVDKLELCKGIVLSYDYTHFSVLLKKNQKIIQQIPIGLDGNISKIGFNTNSNYFYIVLKYSIPYDKHLYINRIVVNKWLYFKIMAADFLNNYVLQVLHCITTHNEWDALKDYTGWYNAFGKQLLHDIDKQLRKDKIRRSWRIMDIKEKYGSLRIYCNYGSNELYKLLGKYEDISYHTCIECGKEAKYLSKGYILPYCEDCFDKQKYRIYAVNQNGTWKFDEDDD